MHRHRGPFGVEWEGGGRKVTEDPQQGQDVLQLLEVIRESKAKQPINNCAQTVLPGQVQDGQVVEGVPERGLNQLGPTESGVRPRIELDLKGLFYTTL